MNNIKIDGFYMGFNERVCWPFFLVRYTQQPSETHISSQSPSKAPITSPIPWNFEHGRWPDERVHPFRVAHHASDGDCKWRADPGNAMSVGLGDDWELMVLHFDSRGDCPENWALKWTIFGLTLLIRTKWDRWQQRDFFFVSRKFNYTDWMVIPMITRYVQVRLFVTRKESLLFWIALQECEIKFSSTPYTVLNWCFQSNKYWIIVTQYRETHAQRVSDYNSTFGNGKLRRDW